MTPADFELGRRTHGTERYLKGELQCSCAFDFYKIKGRKVMEFSLIEAHYQNSPPLSLSASPHPLSFCARAYRLMRQSIALCQSVRMIRLLVINLHWRLPINVQRS